MIKTRLFSCFILLVAVIFNSHSQESPKVISLTPNTTEMILVLGAQSSLAGRSSACNYIPEIENVPIAGNMGSPNMEIIVSIKPDAVVSSVLMNPSDARVIENLGIKFYLFTTESFDEYYATIAELGKILHKEDEANKEIERVKKGFEKFSQQSKLIKKEDKPKVFWEIWNKPIITIGNKSFLNEFINLAGGISITSEVNRNYFEIAKESIFTADPDAIKAPGFPSNYSEQIKNEMGWYCMRAVKENRIYTNLDPNLVSVFGPRMLETIQLIHDLIYQKEQK